MKTMNLKQGAWRHWLHKHRPLHSSDAPGGTFKAKGDPFRMTPLGIKVLETKKIRGKKENAYISFFVVLEKPRSGLFNNSWCLFMNRAWSSTRCLCWCPWDAPGEAWLGCNGDVQQQLGSVHQTLHQRLCFGQGVRGLLSERIHFLEELLPRERETRMGLVVLQLTPLSLQGMKTGAKQLPSEHCSSAPSPSNGSVFLFQMPILLSGHSKKSK